MIEVDEQGILHLAQESRDNGFKAGFKAGERSATKKLRKQVMEAIALLHSDYGYETAIKKLYSIVIPVTDAEDRRMQKITLNSCV